MTYRKELENGRPTKARRERLEWQIKEREKRLAEVDEARLAGSLTRTLCLLCDPSSFVTGRAEPEQVTVFR